MDTPIYLQIKAQILAEIQHKSSNEVIESERALSKRLKVSRMTVRKALDELVEEGLLYREKNKGTFVSDQSLWKKNTLVSHKEDDDVEYRLINFDVKYTIKEDVFKKLELSVREPLSIIRAVRVAIRNKKPGKIEEFYILRNYVDEKNLNKFDILLDLKSYLQDSTMTQQFIPTIVPVQYASTLRLAIDKPIIMVEGVVRNKSGTPYIYYKSYNHPEENVIEITF